MVIKITYLEKKISYRRVVFLMFTVLLWALEKVSRLFLDILSSFSLTFLQEGLALFCVQDAHIGLSVTKSLLQHSGHHQLKMNRIN